MVKKDDADADGVDDDADSWGPGRTPGGDEGAGDWGLFPEQSLQHAVQVPGQDLSPGE